MGAKRLYSDPKQNMNRRSSQGKGLSGNLVQNQFSNAIARILVPQQQYF
jgi:hypothetical protein